MTIGWSACVMGHPTSCLEDDRMQLSAWYRLSTSTRISRMLSATFKYAHAHINGWYHIYHISGVLVLDTNQKAMLAKTKLQERMVQQVMNDYWPNPPHTNQALQLFQRPQLWMQTLKSCLPTETSILISCLAPQDPLSYLHPILRGQPLSSLNQGLTLAATSAPAACWVCHAV